MTSTKYTIDSLLAEFLFGQPWRKFAFSDATCFVVRPFYSINITDQRGWELRTYGTPFPGLAILHSSVPKSCPYGQCTSLPAGPRIQLVGIPTSRNWHSPENAVALGHTARVVSL